MDKDTIESQPPVIIEITPDVSCLNSPTLSPHLENCMDCCLEVSIQNLDCQPSEESRPSSPSLEESDAIVEVAKPARYPSPSVRSPSPPPVMPPFPTPNPEISETTTPAPTAPEPDAPASASPEPGPAPL